MNKMVELGRMKPYCLQLDASLVEVMDSPPPPAHAWTSGVVADIICTILPDLNEAAVAFNGIAILFFGRRVFSEGARTGRSSAPLRGPHHQTDLDNTPHDSSLSPA